MVVLKNELCYIVQRWIHRKQFDSNLEQNNKKRQQKINLSNHFGKLLTILKTTISIKGYQRPQALHFDLLLAHKFLDQNKSLSLDMGHENLTSSSLKFSVLKCFTKLDGKAITIKANELSPIIIELLSSSTIWLSINLVHQDIMIQLLFCKMKADSKSSLLRHTAIQQSSKQECLLLQCSSIYSSVYYFCDE